MVDQARTDSIVAAERYIVARRDAVSPWEEYLNAVALALSDLQDSVIIENELGIHTHKAEGHDDSWRSLYKRIVAETEELLIACLALERSQDSEMRDPAGPNEDLLKELRKNVMDEAADVGNFAMMIADVCGAMEAKGRSMQLYNDRQKREGW